ncbi:MAG: oligosaccharide flippase family protein, partial [Daejeonella sp.]
MSNIKKFAGQTAIYGVSTIVARLLNFILTPIYVKLYAANVYGILTYMYSWASMLNAILSMGMETTFFRYQAKYENDKEKVYNNTFIAIAAISFLFLLFTIFFVDDIAAWMQQGKNFNPDYARYVKLFIYTLVVDALAVIPFAKVRAEGKPMRYAVIKFINIFTFVGLNLFFIYIIPLIIKSGGYGSQFLANTYNPQWVGYVFISNLIASIITLILLLPEILKLKLQIDAKLLKEMFIYSLPVLVANMSFIINENSDKILLGNLLPANIATQEVGIYGACCKIAIFLSIFIQAFRLGAEPFFFSHAKNKNSAETY